MLLINFHLNKWSFQGKKLEQIAFKTKCKIEEHILVVMDKSIHEEHLSQPIHTNNKQFKIAVTFLTGCNRFFSVTSKNNKFYFTKSVSDEDGFFQRIIPKGAYDLESLNNEFKRIIIKEEHYTEANYPFTIKADFSALGSILEISTSNFIFSR